MAIILPACTEQDGLAEPQGLPATRSVEALSATELPGISFQSLLEIAATLATAGVDALSPILEAIDVPGDVASVFLRTFKVSTTYPHPNGSGELIDISGVLIVPAETSDSLRFVISPVPTYTQNSAAPSNIFAGEVPLLYDDFLNYLYFTALNAIQGCAIFMPDYPGYGDSYGQCFHPYAIKDVLVSSTIELAKVAQEVLTEYGYTYKREAIVTGYSQGGLVATAVGRELDLHGEKYDLPINFLLGGGVPANLVDLLDVARGLPPVIGTLPFSFIFPYAILGFKENIAPELVLADLLNAPFDTTCYNILDGQNSVAQAIAGFPSYNSGLLTPDVMDNNMANPSVARLRELLTDNSIEPWANKVPVVFVHGIPDEAVYFSNIEGFVDAMEALGGTPDLHKNPLTEHTLTLLDYFVELAGYIADYK
ncbi:MAG: alpha/beta fold hydrolase [Tannerellaceae bacterium]|nr:alpha/beta fold hydrolase [Tannerellaceae bacterium]